MVLQLAPGVGAGGWFCGMEPITLESGVVLRQIASGLSLVLGNPANVPELLGLLHGKTPSDTCALESGLGSQKEFLV